MKDTQEQYAVASRGKLTTELRNPRSMDLHRLETKAAFDLFNSEDATVADAVAQARGSVCCAIDLVVEAFRAGGRLLYVGAGTSGRLGVLDATECPPTFQSDPSVVVGVIAGGDRALTQSAEAVEDATDSGADAMDEHGVGVNDVVFAVATGGTTPYVHGAIARANQLGAKTVFMSCVRKDEVDDEADVSIRVITGPEVLTGSTRLKAGTATKMVLNMVTTIAMTRTGKVYENLMVDMNTKVNAKLRERGVRTVVMLTGCDRDAAEKLLDDAGGSVKTAVVMHRLDVNASTAERRLDDANGHVGQVLDGAEPMR